jgi:hypothetical protein
MKLPDVPDSLVVVPFGKGCPLRRTPKEVTAGIRRRR